MSPREKRNLTANEFELATQGIKMKADLKLAAYHYMVLGHTFADASLMSELNDRSIQRAVRHIWSRHKALLDAVPPGWVTERVSLPSEEMKAIQERSRFLLEKYHSLFTCK